MNELTDEERYRLTHEIYMLATVRYGAIGFVHNPVSDMNAMIRREREILEKLGYIDPNRRQGW